MQQAVHSGNYTLNVLEAVCKDYQADYEMHLTDLQAAETAEPFSDETKVNVGTYGPRGDDDGPQKLRFVEYADNNQATQARITAKIVGPKNTVSYVQALIY